MELTIDDKTHDKERHNASFGVVHIVAITHPFFGLRTWLALFSGRVPGWDHLSAEVLDQVLNNGTSLSYNDWRAFRALHSNDW